MNYKKISIEREFFSVTCLSFKYLHFDKSTRIFEWKEFFFFFKKFFFCLFLFSKSFFFFFFFFLKFFFFFYCSLLFRKFIINPKLFFQSNVVQKKEKYIRKSLLSYEKKIISLHSALNVYIFIFFFYFFFFLQK